MSERQVTTYVVDGSGGKDLYPLGDPVPGSVARYDAGHGALFLTATDSALTGEFRGVDGQVIDPFSGQVDLELRIVRAVGSPIDRFTEDGLRILRAARFAAASSVRFR